MLKKRILLPLLLSICLVFSGCGASSDEAIESADTTASTIEESAETEESDEVISEDHDESEEPVDSTAEEPAVEPEAHTEPVVTLDLSSIPEYSGSPYVVINDNVPGFTASDLTTTSFESYSELDSLGRCGIAYANIGTDIMPTEERGSIGQVKPSGWHTVKYDIVDGKYLYNRCHLIGYQLSGENANTKNLITGTRYMNVDGMLPFENMVADYVKETGNHVLYRVTPVFENDNLVASGVQMEAMSVEDNGDGILYNVYCYNAQPGISIDYATGDSWQNEAVTTTAESSPEPAPTPAPGPEPEPAPAVEPVTPAPESSTPVGTTYILNTNTHKFHYPSCSSVGQMKESNKKEYTGNRDDVIAQGYDPCKRCNP